MWLVEKAKFLYSSRRASSDQAYVHSEADIQHMHQPMLLLRQREG